MLLASAAEVWECSWGDDVCVGVQRRPLSWVIKSQFGSVHVQYNSNDVQLLIHSERRPRCGTGFVLPITQSNGPESFGGGQHVLSFPVDGCAGHSDDPVGVIFHLNIPAVPSRAKALAGQRLRTHVKAFRVVGEIVGLSTAL